MRFMPSGYGPRSILLPLLTTVVVAAVIAALVPAHPHNGGLVAAVVILLGVVVVATGAVWTLNADRARAVESHGEVESVGQTQAFVVGSAEARFSPRGYAIVGVAVVTIATVTPARGELFEMGHSTRPGSHRQGTAATSTPGQGPEQTAQP